MLGRLRMPVEDCLLRYPQLAESVFEKKRSILTRVRNKSSTKYDNEKLEKAIKDIVNARVPKSEKAPRQKEYTYLGFSSPEDLCKT